MDALQAVDLITLLEQLPPLQEACVTDDIRTLRRLRLVSKEASRVALLGLKTYTLTLTGDDDDTDARVASLLQTTSLDSLCLRLDLSDSFSPTVLLTAFLLAVGPGPLRTVTTLDLQLDDTCDSSATAALLNHALAQLAITLPSLTSFICHSELLTSLWCSLGQACKLLSSVTLHVTSEDLSYLEDFLLLQPALLPGVSSLSLPYLARDPEDLELPDMSNNVSILVLHLPKCGFLHKAHWHDLPPRMQHLDCSTVWTSPWVGVCEEAANAPNNLQSLTIERGNLDLSDLVQILHAAPALHSLALRGRNITSERGQQQPCIDCGSPTTTTSLEMTFLQQRLDLSNLKFFFEFEFMAACSPYPYPLPCMNGVTSCEAWDCDTAELSLIVDTFPDVVQLTLRHLQVDDVDLQVLAACQSITTLTLTQVRGISPMGLHALCQRLPRLCHVSIKDCDDLSQGDINVCGQLLQGRVTLVDETEEGDRE